MFNSCAQQMSTSSSKRTKPDEVSASPLKLRFVGFCGVDESFPTSDQDKHPWPEYIEWGVLFREENVGRPRFPAREYVESFTKSKSRHLAAHLCSSRCEQVLKGDFSFVQELHSELGFQRFQINATKANGVESSKLGSEHVKILVKLAQELPHAEFIIQRNEETKPLWQGLEEEIGEDTPRNISYLFDASVGTGVVVSSFPKPKYAWAKYGYAGGIKPENVKTIVEAVAANVPPGVVTWIDMESGIREKENDAFSVERAWKVCEIIESLRETGVISTDRYVLNESNK